MKRLLLAGWIFLAGLPMFAANIVVNFGFESGLTGWTVSGGAGSNWTAGAGPHSGSGAVSDGCTGAACITTPTSALFQDLATSIGSVYVVSFWAASGSLSPGVEIQALLGGTVVKDVTSFSSTTYALYTSATFTAVSTTTRLQFNGRDDPAFLQLDDVCVDVSGGVCGGVAAGVPEPGSYLLTGAAGVLLFALRRFRIRL